MATGQGVPASSESWIDEVPLPQLAERLRARLIKEVGLMSKRSQAQEVIPLFNLAIQEVRKALNVTYWVPPEVLERIFQYVPGSILDEGKDYRDQGDLPFCFRNHRVVRTRDVIPLTHVCQRWRKIVMNMPRLWHIIDSRMRIPYEDCVSRSRGLSLGAYFHGKPRVDLVDWLQDHATVLKELHCIAFGHVGGIDYDWGPLLRIVFPNLRVATLAGTHTMTEGEATFQMASSLHQLHLAHTNWLPKGHFPHLTRLFLSDWTGSCEVVHLLSFLRECPNLVDITFRHLFHPVRGTIPADRENVVWLPHLQRLNLQYFDPGDIGHCLSHMHVHSTTALCVRMPESLWFSGMDVRDIRAMSQFPAAKQCTRLHILMRAEYECTVTALSESSGVHISSVGTFDRGSGELRLAQLLPLSQVEELWLVENEGYGALDYILKSELFDILPQMHALRKVVMTSPVLRKLSAPRASHDQLGVDDLWPPHLHELHVLLYPKHAEHLAQEELAESMTLLANSRVPRRSVMVPEHCAVLRNRVEDLHLEDKIECDVYQHTPSIALPPVCSTEEELWPAWQTYLDPSPSHW